MPSASALRPGALSLAPRSPAGPCPRSRVGGWTCRQPGELQFRDGELAGRTGAGRSAAAAGPAGTRPDASGSAARPLWVPDAATWPGAAQQVAAAAPQRPASPHVERGQQSNLVLSHRAHRLHCSCNTSWKALATEELKDTEASWTFISSAGARSQRPQVPASPPTPTHSAEPRGAEHGGFRFRGRGLTRG